MAQYTQKAILSTFQQMLEEMPFDKITVSALVRRCEISSNTSYYHYSDIYDLLDVWLRGELSVYVSGEAPYDDWRYSTKAFMKACAARPNIVYHIFNSLSRDRMERYVFSLSSDVFYSFVTKSAAAYSVPEEKLREIADFCRYSFAGFFLRFLWGRMKADVDATVDSYAVLVDGFVENAVRKFPQRA